MTHFPAGPPGANRESLQSARANAGLGNASVCFLSQNAGLIFFFPEAPNLISRFGISGRPSDRARGPFFSCAGEKTRPRNSGNERFASFTETRRGFAHRLRAFSPRRDEIIDAFSRFRRTGKTREPHFAAGVVLRKNVRVGCIARRTRTLLQHSRDERIRDSRARARVRPRRAPDGHRALRRRRVPPLPPAGASPIRKSLFFRENAFRVKRRTRREARASPRRARTRAHRDESPRIRQPELPT